MSLTEFCRGQSLSLAFFVFVCVPLSSDLSRVLGFFLTKVRSTVWPVCFITSSTSWLVRPWRLTPSSCWDRREDKVETKWNKVKEIKEKQREGETKRARREFKLVMLYESCRTIYADKTHRAGSYTNQPVVDSDVSTLICCAAGNHVFHKHTDCIWAGDTHTHTHVC